MPERLHPGVYVEEISGGVRPIQGVGTSTAGFIGEAERGIPDRAQFLNGFADYQRRFGGHRRGDAGFLAQAVEAFFNAGGRRAYVVRVLPNNATAGVSPAVDARADDAWNNRHQVLRFEAQGRGAWSNAIRIHIANATSFPNDAFQVRVEWTEGGRSRVVERFDDVRMDPEHEDYAVRAINEASQYIRATDLFQTNFIDAEPQTAPPIPERRPSLTTTPNTAFDFPVGAQLQFLWRDLAAPVDPTAAPATGTVVTFEGDPTQATPGVDPADVVTILEGALGNRFVVSTANNRVTVEPAIATRGYLVATATDGTFDLTGITKIHVTAAVPTAGGPSVDYETPDGAALPTGGTAAALAAHINAIVPADDPFGVVAEAEGNLLIVRARHGQGVRLGVSQEGGADPWNTVVVSDGLPGALVDDVSAVEISVSEIVQPGVRRILNGLFPAPKARGLRENSPSDPNLRPALTGDDPLRLLGGTDGTGIVTAADYRGDAQQRTGLRAFDIVDIQMLAIPGRNTPDFLAEGIAYSDRSGKMFFVADGVGSVDPNFEITADEVRNLVEGLPMRSNNAAMFYPWIEVPDPVGVGRNPRRLVPPSGHITGVFARTDVTRGVWKAPAGIEAVVSGAVDVQHRLVDADQDLLNPIGLNCIRQFPNVGIVSWGSRTLASDPEWRYVPVRRTALFLKESLRRGLQWAVFEPNDTELWDRIRININAFMLSLFRQGAFQGDTPDEAFLVKCDRETNPQEMVDQGIVSARVAFAPLKPAEFVVIEISQKSLLAA